MNFLKTLFGRRDPREALIPLYHSIVRTGRDRWWYAEGGVPDTLDGRFDMIAAVVALVLIRIEDEGEAGRQPSALLTELFIDDMDSQLRQIGIGDIVVGKHIGKMMSALGGRMQAYRDALQAGEGLEEALARNMWRGEPPEQAKVAAVAERLTLLSQALAAQSWQALAVNGMESA